MKLRVTLACAASVFALGAAGGGAWAQDTSQPDQSGQIETVVVTGVRASLKSAQTIKKNANQFVDSIVAEDIGKLPDNQVIDALQHVTGLQVQHGNGSGENNQIWIRGLPDIATTLNGREIFTTTGRFLSLADIPADLLQRVDVKKSTEANDVEGGLAGLIDVRLHRPFDFDGLEVAGSVHGLYGSVSQHVDPRVSLLISDRWNTTSGEVGVLLDVSYVKQHYIDEDAFDYYSGAIVTDGVKTAHAPETIGGIQYPGSRERASVNFSTQWRPNTNTEFYAEMFYTRYRNPNAVNFLIGLPGNNNPVLTLTTQTDPNGNEVLKSETSCCFNLTSNQSFNDSTNTFQYAAGGTWTGNNLTLSSELDYTDSDYAHRGAIIDTAIFTDNSFDTNYQDKGTPNMGTSDPAYWLVNTNYHPTQLFDQWTKQYGNEIDWRGDATYSFADSILKAIDGGVRYTNRFGKSRADSGNAISCYSGTDDKGYDPDLVNSVACNGGAWFFNDITKILPGDAFTRSIGKFFDGERAWGIPTWMNANPDWTLKHIAAVRAAFGQDTAAPPELPSNSFDDREQGYTAYAKFDYGAEIASMPLDGNIGVRFVDTKAVEKAFITSFDANSQKVYTPIESRKDSSDWLPSFNAKLSIQDDLLLRFAAGRTVTRPTFAQLNPGLTLSDPSLTFSPGGAAGNPDLAPVKSDNVDLGLEYYFGNQNLLNGTVFYRHVDGYIQYLSAPEVYNGVTYEVTRPQNSGLGYLQGVEAGYTQWFDMLPGAFSGLGLQANATFIEGWYHDILSGLKVPYGGVSKYSFNIIPMYEYGPVSVRLSYNWRSSYTSAISLADATSIQPNFAVTKPYGELGLSVNYNWDEHLVLSLDASNVLDSIYQDHFGNGAFAKIYPRDTRHYDQVIEFGVRYKM